MYITLIYTSQNGKTTDTINLLSVWLALHCLRHKSLKHAAACNVVFNDFAVHVGSCILD